MKSRKQAGKRVSADSPERSDAVDCEFLNDGICQQFGGQFGGPVRYHVGAGGRPVLGYRPVLGERAASGPVRNGRIFGGLVSGLRDLHLEPLALADRDHLAEPEPVARPRDGFALRVVDLGLEHDVHHYLGHSTQRTRTVHLTSPEERRVLSQRNTMMTDDR